MTAKQKYTILKVLIQNSTKGFTVIELIFGLLIMLLIGGFTMNALIEAGNSFNKDKKDIQSAQNLTAVLELIGNDVKQSGERIINDDNFPTIEIRQESSATLADGSPIQRSTLIVRRGLVPSALTLCADIPVGTAAGITNLVVRDTTLPVGTNPGCNQNPAASLNPDPLRVAVNYRCELGDPNYSYTPGQDSCNPIPANPNNIPALQKGLIAISRPGGNICMFEHTGENLAFSPTQSTLTVAALSTCANTVAYNTNLPIYLIEERRYTLDTSGNLQVSVNGGTPSTLISGIAKFKVSARGYISTPATPLENRVIDPTGGGAAFACTAADVTAGVSPSAGTNADPTYACRLNFGANVANWKQIAGVRIELQAKYDPTGRETYASAAAIPNNKNIEQLKASAEFFPRNVLSK
jgi:type II secretory pathway pseudopilin PulG